MIRTSGNYVYHYVISTDLWQQWDFYFRRIIILWTIFEERQSTPIGGEETKTTNFAQRNVYLK